MYKIELRSGPSTAHPRNCARICRASQINRQFCCFFFLFHVKLNSNRCLLTLTTHSKISAKKKIHLEATRWLHFKTKQQTNNSRGFLFLFLLLLMNVLHVCNKLKKKIRKYTTIQPKKRIAGYKI